MAQTEDIVILNVETGAAVENIGDLKNNISTLKKELETLDIGSQEYQNTLGELRLNQNALKDAMYATSSSMADVSQSAQGAGESYNALVHRMAALKEEFRSTNDTLRRAELGKQIKDVNDQLKDLDALQGNYQRNVGNYAESFKSAFKSMAENVDALGKSIKVTGGGVEGFKNGFEALAKSPAIAIIGLLVSVFLKLSERLKDNEKAAASLKKGMDALKPVTQFISGVVEKMADVLTIVIEKVSAFLGSSGLFQKVIDGAVGVGNAVLQFVIAPFRGIVKAIGVLKDEGVKGLGEAAKAFASEMKQGVAFRSNYQAGQAVAETIAAGAKSRKKEVTGAITEVVADAVQEGVEQGFTMADFDKALAIAEKKLDEARKLRMDEQKELDALVQADVDATNASIEAMLDGMARMDEQARREAEETAQARIDTMYAVAGVTSSILNDLADMYEQDSENNAAAARRAKNIRTASATIDTIAGAVGAFMQGAKSAPAPYGLIIGAAQAAAVTATGMAEIAKIRNTNISTSGGSNPSVGASVSAPNIGSNNIPQTSIVNSASQEDRLNQMASSQRVYILDSDIEAADEDRKALIEKTSF